MASRNRASEDILDAQNREYADRLASKSSFLKSIAFDIESEAKDHHKLLNGLDDEFDSTGSVNVLKILLNSTFSITVFRRLKCAIFFYLPGGFLAGTMSRVKHMMGTGRGNRQLMCYVSIGIVVFMFFVYFLIRRVMGGSTEGEA